MTGEGVREQKRAATRQRLLDEGLRLFGERGYDGVTSAEIAASAGVTERTFFRHFATKADLVLANWHRHAAALEAAMAKQPDDARPIDVVRAGVEAFAARLARSVRDEPARSMLGYGGRLPVLTMLEIVLALESSISEELARRLGRTSEDLDIRIVANASIGIMRACGRAYVQTNRRTSLAQLVSQRLDELAPLFDALDAPEP
jgi:TetR/AcrR family transcriptional regulator, regulator of mycofactocin system